MIFNECVHNWSCMRDWALSNIAWGLLSALVIFLLFKFLPRTVQAIRITKTILKDNRDTRGNAWGKYSADRFLDIWYSSENLPLRHEHGQFYVKTFNNPNSRHWMDFIDKELVKLGIIEIFDGPRDYKAVKPVRSWRNELTAKLTQWYLIKFVGDNPQYYKDMREQRERNG